MGIQQTFVGNTTVPTYISNVRLTNQTSDSSRTLTITTHQVGDMLIALTGNRTTTAPALLSNYTNITSTNNAQARSLRVQFKFATDASESITWTGAYGYIIAVRCASSVIQSNTTNVNSNATTIELPNLSNLDTSGKGLIIAGTYVTNIITAITSPYTVVNSTFGIISNNSSSDQTSKTITASSSIARSTFAIEIL